ncbi:MAG: NADH-quinone oxidoreductase subunit L [Chitinophagales bacterium]|nr:NADH-quinone oxidoreductase subunit L [Chitinophagales bacterium]
MNSFAWLIPFLPLTGFLINGLGFRKLSKGIVSIVGCGSVLLSFCIVAGIFIQSLSEPVYQRIDLYDWMSVGSFNISFSFLIDPLSIIMMLIITGVGFLIHIYSAGYMKDDEGYGKFFAYMNLFIFFMLLLVMGSSYIIMFIGWEGVGLCSYLLIGFWWKNQEFTTSANKAFIMNRIGDLGFILGIFLMFITFGSSDFDKVFQGAFSLQTNDVVIISITLLLLIGAIGKSAQIPLFTWLPDAMAGPTPVSALIHAATMVTAGIYMVVRSNILYSLAPFSLTVISVVGTSTALFAALIALTQNDIKKVLAYSTISQLGYMFAALGSSAYESGIFHVMTHAFFKALLFLGAGSVIHSMGGEQNIRKMGSLRKAMPVTAFTFLIGTLAISGFPPFSGFFSKDAILSAAYSYSTIVFTILCITSVLTAAYMYRLYFMVFWGRFRGSPHQQEHLHESATVITVPLIMLAALAAFSGFLGLPHNISNTNLLSEYLAPVFVGNSRIMEHSESSSFEWMLAIFSLIILSAILWLAYKRYNRENVAVSLNEAVLPLPYKLSYHKFYIDEVYNTIILKPIKSLGVFLSNKIEKYVIDGSVNGVGDIALFVSSQLRKIQTGNIGLYVLLMVGGIILILIYGLSNQGAF